MDYDVQDILSWYQKKIGTYDKQEWEKTVEQRILSGFTHIPKKTAKLKTDLIDVDLVRGSSFTKAKPKHGLLTILRLGLMRLLFLPIYVKWWSYQISKKMFVILFVLYILQLANVVTYFNALYNHPEVLVSQIGISEIIVPTGMMILLSTLHSQIVSPRSSGRKNLAPFNNKCKRIKRIKKRSMRCSIKTPTSDSAPDIESTTKSFRDNNFEENKGVRRRNVAWNTSPQKHLPRPLKPDLKVVAAVDDGFESLDVDISSSGSSGDRPTEACDNVVIEKTIEKQEIVIKNAPEAVFRNNWLEQSARSASSKNYITCIFYYFLTVGLERLSSGTDKDSDSDVSNKIAPQVQRLICRRRGSKKTLQVDLRPEHGESSCNTSDDGENESFCPALTEGTTSAAEWIGITTNSEDCSVSSEIDEQPFASEFHMSPSAILSPSCAASDKVSCTMWEKDEVIKAELSVLDISSAIIARVEAIPKHMDYFYAGMVVSVFLGILPSICRLFEAENLPALPAFNELSNTSIMYTYFSSIARCGLGANSWEVSITTIAFFERVAISCLFFFLLAVAERTFKQRFLYAKFFSHLTSCRRARKSELPHFRLNKVRNIKTWLSKRGPQHSVDIIISTVFTITLVLLAYIAMEHLNDAEKYMPQCNIEALAWSLILSFFLLRFMTLGTKINRKYRNLSVLITEQINLYLQIEQKPNKKEELMVANSVLKLAADLLKELETPYKISGFSANPYLYTITKVVILSALSGALSEMLGFKLKLHKIKIK